MSDTTGGETRAGQQFAAGTVVFDNFEIVSMVGRGGMGTVYRAKNLALDAIVALKVLNLGHGRQNERLVLFQNEARVLSRLAHSNIASVFDFSVSSTGVPFMVMEFVEGSPLDELLKRGDGPVFDVSACLSLFMQMALALSHAHNKGVIHRDLKPANVMVRAGATAGDDSAGRQLLSDVSIKLLDFGIARLVLEERQADSGESGAAAAAASRQGKTEQRAVVGSPKYMSPEQSHGEDGDARTDIYSMGCIMFEVLTGEPPFLADTVVGTLSLHRDAPVPELVALPGYEALVEALAPVVGRALAKSPDDRYASAELLNRALEDAHEKLFPPESFDAGTAGDARGPSRAVSGRVVLIALALLLTAGVGYTWKSWSSFFDSAMQKGMREKVSLKVRTPLEIFSDEQEDTVCTKIIGDGESADLGFLDVINPAVIEKLPASTRYLVIRMHKELTDASLANLDRLNLRELNLSFTSVRSLSFLKNVTTLRELQVQETLVDDSAIPILAGLTRLDKLVMDRTKVTGKRLLSLKSLASLRSLSVTGCKNVHADDVARLSALVPVCSFPGFCDSYVDRMLSPVDRASAAGKLDEALVIGNKIGKQIVAKWGIKSRPAIAWQLKMAAVLSEADRVGEAASALEKAAGSADALGDLYDIARTRKAYHEVLLSQGRIDAAIASDRAFLAALDRLNDDDSGRRWRALYALSSLEEERGHLGEAVSACRQASTFTEGMRGETEYATGLTQVKLSLLLAKTGNRMESVKLKRIALNSLTLAKDGDFQPDDLKTLAVFFAEAAVRAHKAGERTDARQFSKFAESVSRRLPEGDPSRQKAAAILAGLPR